MHVAILCEYGSVNGGENSMLAMAEQLPEIEFTFLAPADGPLAQRFRDSGLRHLPFSIREANGERLSREASIAALQEMIDSIRPSLLHANSLAMGRLTGAMAPSVSIPTTSHLRDIIRLSRAAVDDLNQNTSLIAVSEATKRHHVAQGLSSDRTEVIYNGIDPGQFSDRHSSFDLRVDLGLSPISQLIATIGQISLRKGQDIFVKSSINLAERLPDAHWLIIGERHSSKEETVAYERQMRESIAAASLDDRVHWLGYRSDVPVFLSQLNLLIHSARQEPLGRVLLEALAAGVPVIATDVGGTDEIITHEQSGVLVPVDDVAAVQRETVRVLKDQSLCKRFARKGRETSKERFDVLTQAAQLKHHWQRAVEANSRDVDH